MFQHNDDKYKTVDEMNESIATEFITQNKNLVIEIISHWTDNELTPQERFNYVLVKTAQTAPVVALIVKLISSAFSLLGVVLWLPMF